MDKHYMYFQNSKCEYFPCHKTDKEIFNCLFCFCPLYMLKEECGGNFVNNNGIKDCSKCFIPHSKGGYEHIMSKMEKVIKEGSKFK